MNSQRVETSREKVRRRGKPLIVAFVTWICWALVALFLYRWSGALGLLIGLLLLGGLAFFGLAVVLLVTRRESWQKRRQDIGQLQRDISQLRELQWLSSRISHRRPLPFPLHSTGFEARLEALNAAWELIIQQRPQLVLELGSGLSSLVMAYALETNGQGILLAMENSADYAGQTRTLLAEHDHSDRACAMDAPLGPVNVNGETRQWYTLGDLRLEKPIDFLFVDGPVGYLAPLARYPALPILREYLADDAYVLLDDTDREQEKLIVQRWLEEFPEIQACDPDSHRNVGFTLLQLSRAKGAPLKS